MTTLTTETRRHEIFSEQREEPTLYGASLELLMRQVFSDKEHYIVTPTIVK